MIFEFMSRNKKNYIVLLTVNLLRVASVLQVLDVDTYRTTSVMLPPILLDNLYNLRSLHLRGILSIRYGPEIH